VIRVLLVDDQELVRAGLGRIFRSRAGFEIVGECEDGDQVEAAAARTEPDVIVMDIRMRRVDGAEATRRLRQREDAPPVLVLTTYDDDDTLAAALRAGAAGFQLKDAPGEELQQAVRAVAEGGSWLDPDICGRVLTAYRATQLGPAAGAAGDGLARLTSREADVLRLVARGANNVEIAGELGISEVTVKTHIGHLFTKLGVRDRAAAIVWAFDHGVVAAGG